MFGANVRNSCRSLLTRLQILSFPSEYIFLFMNFVVNNQKRFQTNTVEQRLYKEQESSA
jgi:hypothetical protein